MKIELKNIRHYERMSEETEAFVADVFVDGQKAGVAKNEGHGGNTGIQGYNAKGSELLKQADQYCKTLPPKTYGSGSGSFTVDMNLENFVDGLFDKYLDKKDSLAFERKMNKATAGHLVVGISDTEYATIKLIRPVSELLQSARGEEYLKNIIARHVIPNLKEGRTLINNNIPEKIFRDAGLKEGQFTPNNLKTITERPLKRPNKPSR